MDSRNLLILLVAIFAYINVYIPLHTTNNKKTKKLTMYKTKLINEKKFLKNSKKYETYVQDSNATLHANQSLINSATLQDAIIFNTMQSKIKNLVRITQGKLVNIIWGEPFSTEKGLYTILPFTFIVEVKPQELSTFLQRLFSNPSAIVIKQMFIGKKDKNLLVNMQIYMYKNKGDVKL